MRSILLLAALSGAGCGGGGGGGVAGLETARQTMIGALGNDVIVPTFNRLADRADTLRDALVALAAAPDATRLAAARDAWSAARDAWNRSEAFLVGPPDDLFLASKIDTSPIDAPRIEEEIAGIVTIDEPYIESLGSTRKGFFAIEFFLFGGADPAIVAALGDARRAAYVAALGQNLAKICTQIRDVWAPAGSNFVAEFTRPQGRFGSTKQVEDVLVNRLLVVVETIADKRLGRPLGRTSGGLPQPEGSEAERSGTSVASVREDIRSIRNLYDGTFEGATFNGLREPVRFVSAPIDEAFRTALQNLENAIALLSDPIESTDEDDLIAAFDLAKELNRRVLLDIVGALNTTLTFSPFDGD